MLAHLRRADPIEAIASLSHEQLIEAMDKRIEQITNFIDEFLKQNHSGVGLRTVNPSQHPLRQLSGLPLMEVPTYQIHSSTVNVAASGN